MKLFSELCIFFRYHGDLVDVARAVDSTRLLLWQSGFHLEPELENYASLRCGAKLRFVVLAEDIRDSTKRV